MLLVDVYFFFINRGNSIISADSIILYLNYFRENCHLIFYFKFKSSFTSVHYVQINEVIAFAFNN